MKSTAFKLSQEQAFQVDNTGRPLSGLGLTLPFGIQLPSTITSAAAKVTSALKIPSVADIQKFISDATKTVNNYNIIGRKIAALQAKINSVRTSAAKSAMNQKIASARSKYNTIASSIEKLKGGLGNANSILAQIRSTVTGGRSSLGFIPVAQLAGIITATTILVAVGGTLLTINRYIDNLDKEAQRQLDLERQQQEANYCASYPNDPRCGGVAPQTQDYQYQLQQQYYQQYQQPTQAYYQPAVQQPTYEQYYYPYQQPAQQQYYPQQQYYQPQAQTYYTPPVESYFDLEQEFGLFGLNSSDDQNRLNRQKSGLQGERSHKFDDILDIIPGIEGLGARDQRWDLKKNVHISHSQQPGLFGRDQRWDVRKHVSHSNEPGMFGFGARDQRYDRLKKAGLGKGGCGRITCLLKEVGL